MLEQIENLGKILNESYSQKSLESLLTDFFGKNFQINDFHIKFFDAAEDIASDFQFEYPIYKHKKRIASLCFDTRSKKLDEFLDLSSPFISLKIQNIILGDKMQKNIDFHDTMKHIAKIIETQYELNFIIPLIGEMIDKFFTDYLIYIFLYENDSDKLKLAWPALCKDHKILNLIENLEYAKMSNDEKIYAIPLISDGKNVGVLTAKSTSDIIIPKDRDYLEQIASQIATTINRANVYAEILKHATLDALTGFYNRHQLEVRIKQEVSNAKRQHAPLCGIMTDIDYFKHVNDTYGHAVGDLVLKTISKAIRGQLREYDIAGRYGGEEFSLLLPFTKIDEAKMVAERLRKAVENKVIDISKINPDCGVKQIKITMSLGIYEIKESDNEEDLIRKADKALYEAKNTGRNKVVVYNE